MKIQPTCSKSLGYGKSGPRQGKYIAMQASIQTLERTQIHKLTLHLKKLEKEQQVKPTSSRRREIIKIQAELNEIENRTTRTDQQNWEFVL